MPNIQPTLYDYNRHTHSGSKHEIGCVVFYESFQIHTLVKKEIPQIKKKQKPGNKKLPSINKRGQAYVNTDIYIGEGK